MLGVLAGFEMNLRPARHMERIAKANSRGV